MHIYSLYSLLLVFAQELRDSIELTPSALPPTAASQAARTQQQQRDMRNVESIILENIHLSALSNR